MELLGFSVTSLPPPLISASTAVKVTCKSVFPLNLFQIEGRADLSFHPYLLLSYAAAAAAKLLQSCPTLCDPMNCSLPGSSLHGILQARVLEWVAISFSNAGK